MDSNVTVSLCYSGKVHAIYGSGEPGLLNGSASQSQFKSPQGLVWNGDSIYVADTENHVIRKVSYPQ